MTGNEFCHISPLPGYSKTYLNTILFKFFVFKHMFEYNQKPLQKHIICRIQMGTFKKRLFAQFAMLAKALSNGNRLEILEFLAQCEYSVDDLAKVMKLSVANTSHHLQLLRDAGLVTNRKEAQRVFYRLSDNDITELLACLRGVAERHMGEVNQIIGKFLTSKDAMEPVSRDALLKLAKEGSVTILDVRPPAEYNAGHIPGAVNIPLATLRKKLSKLDPGKEIVAYCRGPYCVLAFEAAKTLRHKGFQVRRLQDGYPEWKNAGFPVTTGRL